MINGIIDSIMNITLQQVTFAVLSVVIIGSALMVVTLRNMFHSLLFLMMSFIGVAGIYLMLSADFMAAIQILIYIGAISVLLMFALMLTHQVMKCSLKQTTSQIWVAVPVTIGLLVVLVRVFVLHPWGYQPEVIHPTTGIIGKALMTDYLLPFELASVLLLVAMIGAIVLAKEDKPDDPA
ncbi:MAG: NADH-quinone oxidoreductase subunit J family protein [Armatimonadota bacterium]